MKHIRRNLFAAIAMAALSLGVFSACSSSDDDASEIAEFTFFDANSIPVMLMKFYDDDTWRLWVVLAGGSKEEGARGTYIDVPVGATIYLKKWRDPPDVNKWQNAPSSVSPFTMQIANDGTVTNTPAMVTWISDTITALQQ